MMAHATDTSLKEESFISICDLLIMFGHASEGTKAVQAALAPLVYKPDQSMGEFLNYFIQASPGFSPFPTRDATKWVILN